MQFTAPVLSPDKGGRFFRWVSIPGSKTKTTGVRCQTETMSGYASSDDAWTNEVRKTSRAVGIGSGPTTERKSRPAGAWDVRTLWSAGNWSCWRCQDARSAASHDLLDPSALLESSQVAEIIRMTC